MCLSLGVEAVGKQLSELDVSGAKSLLKSASLMLFMWDVSLSVLCSLIKIWAFVTQPIFICFY